MEPRKRQESGEGAATGRKGLEPLLYRKREYLRLLPSLGTTTSCQTTSNPSDYGPDD